MKRKLALLLIIAFLALPAAATNAATVEDVANQLICQCGCTQVLSKCAEPVCSTREEMKGLIREKLNQGQTQQEIIQSFVAQYGEKVLASPSKTGFNLTVWLAPIAAILLGGIVIYATVKKMLRQGKQTDEITAVPEKEDEAYRRRLEKDLKDFGDGGFR
ncbi:MAG: cytochrome c-type biogenesis protein CcmH [Dehalococcoidales bacterium]|nr:cytochrome c-type biogenesis protein CcmH [Dehalococcoidales bacterium]